MKIKMLDSVEDCNDFRPGEVSVLPENFTVSISYEPAPPEAVATMSGTELERWIAGLKKIRRIDRLRAGETYELPEYQARELLRRQFAQVAEEG